MENMNLESIFYDTRTANAILDRILHHCTVIQIVGDPLVHGIFHVEFEVIL